MVFGHRRHQACLELGIPVLAIVVDNMSDKQLFLEMDQENRARKDLSAWEQAISYQRSLDDGLFPSQNALAQALTLSQGNVSSVLKILEIPSKIIEAFPNPNDIRFRWVREILNAIEEDRVGVLERAEFIKDQGNMKALQVFNTLTKRSNATIKWNKKIHEVKFSKKRGSLSIMCEK